MKFRLIKPMLAVGLVALVVAGCLPHGVDSVRVFCDRIIIRYTNTLWAGTNPYIEARLGYEDDDIPDEVLAAGRVPIYTSGRILIEFDQEYPAGTPMYVYFEQEDIPANHTASEATPCTSSTTEEDEPEVTWFEPGDDRINRQPYASVAVYCDMDNSRVALYAINASGEGVGTAFVPFSTLPPVPTDGNTLIGEQGGYSFHRLTTGEYQVTAPPDAEGKQYVVIFDGCPNTYLNAYILQNGVLTQTEAS